MLILKYEKSYFCVSLSLFQWAFMRKDLVVNFISFVIAVFLLI